MADDDWAPMSTDWPADITFEEGPTVWLVAGVDPDDDTPDAAELFGVFSSKALANDHVDVLVAAGGRPRWTFDVTPEPVRDGPVIT